MAKAPGGPREIPTRGRRTPAALGTGVGVTGRPYFLLCPLGVIRAE